jgi:hypothetical protein
VLRQGPFSVRLHALGEYAIGGFFIASPFIFAFDNGIAVAIGIVGGIALILLAATSEAGLPLSGIVPVRMHVVLDVLVAAFFVASPFIFGFSGEAAPTALFIATGVVHLLSTVGTRFLPPPSGAAVG